jgi:hypothetical protein
MYVDSGMVPKKPRIPFTTEPFGADSSGGEKTIHAGILRLCLAAAATVRATQVTDATGFSRSLADAYRGGTPNGPHTP